MTSRVEKFAAWWLASRPLKPPVDGAYFRVGSNTGTTLYRDREFQVQMFLCDPNSEITDHAHPNVDSVQVYVSGDMTFRRNDVVTPLSEAPAGTVIGLLPSDVHGATIGPRGAVFITIQEWLNGEVPRSVHLDWQGPALSQGHASELGAV